MLWYVVCKQVIISSSLVWSSLTRKMARLHGQAKVIKYRLIEELSQTFNTVSSIINVLKKCEFSL